MPRQECVSPLTQVAPHPVVATLAVATYGKEGKFVTRNVYLIVNVVYLMLACLFQRIPKVRLCRGVE